MGKLFVIRARRNREQNGLTPHFLPATEPRRHFWLCESCSRSLTIQASGFGRVRIAHLEIQPPDGSSISIQELGGGDCAPEAGCVKQDDAVRLDALKKELDSLECGGYRSALGWLPPLIFEDSPICPKASHQACPDNRCMLMDYVPEEQRHEKIPCRHIPLNELSETLDSLYKSATMPEIEGALRAWLKSEIGKLEPSRAWQEPEAN